MKRTDKISGIPALLKLVQSWLWYNEKYKIFFSTHHTNNPQQYYCFFLDIRTGKRIHGIYRVTTEALLVEFLGAEYIVTELATMKKYDILMIQLTCTKNELLYYNWLAVPIPEDKGVPYVLKRERESIK